jgi:hypothetical protein
MEVSKRHLDAPVGSINIRLVCFIAHEVPPVANRGNTCGAHSAEGIQHHVSLERIELDATVRQLNWKWSRMANPPS